MDCVRCVVVVCVRCEVLVWAGCVFCAGCALCVRCGVGWEAACVDWVLRDDVAVCDVRLLVAGWALCELVVREEVLCCVRAGSAVVAFVLVVERVLVVVRDEPDCSTACCR